MSRICWAMKNYNFAASNQWRHLVLLALVLGSLIVVLLQAPIKQDLAYHHFIDTRNFFGIPNFYNVISNFPFFLTGIAGVLFCTRRASVDVRPEWLCFFAGITLVSIGSAYYHFNPDNQSLVWDRLPMTLMFMALFSLIIHDFLGEKTGKIGFWLAVPFGIFSVIYWHFTECAGCGDLRPYGFVQFFPLAIVPILFAFFSKMVGYGRTMALALGLYAMAKVAEHYDDAIFETLGFWSGHTIKHLLAAAGLWFAVRMLDDWQIEKGVSIKNGQVVT